MTLSGNQGAMRGEILVVEDTPSSLKLLSDLLSGADYAVRQAPNGALALWTVDASLPDLILLDINMPDMDGFEVCRRLKENPATAEVPVIFLSAQFDSEDIVAGLNLGAVDYVGKPYVAEEVLARVRTHVELAQMRKALQAERGSLETRVVERTAQLQEIMDALCEELRIRKSTESQLRLAGTVFDSSFDAILVMDGQQQILTANPAFVRLCGYTGDELDGQSFSLLEANKNEPGLFALVWNHMQTHGYWSGEFWVRHKDSNVFPAQCSLTAARNAAGEITHVIGLLLSVAERRDTETLVDFLVHHDPLTGLPNRSTAVTLLERQLVSAPSNESELVVMCLGLDRFKPINDLMGHSAGDRVLQLVSAAITENLLPGDIAYRQGADGFVVVRTDKASMQKTSELAYSLLDALHTEFDLDEGRVSVSASIGIASAGRESAELLDLVRNAGAALSWIRREGSNGFAYFSAEMDAEVRKRFETEVRLRDAIAGNQLELYYQPQIELASGKLVGAEALLRWKDPERGFISPAEFIPIAEATGQILAIGAWVLETACKQIRTWLNEGLPCPRIAVNCSTRQFLQHSFCDSLAAVVAEHNVSGDYLEIEITEGAMVQDVAQTTETLERIKELGMSVSVDDFGTGYSSLSYLKSFPVDVLKIDQSFIRDMLKDQAAMAIVLSIISLAHNLHLKVIAEGVETREECDFLRANQCDQMQGYYFSKPVPAHQFRDLITGGKGLAAA